MKSVRLRAIIFRVASSETGRSITKKSHNVLYPLLVALCRAWWSSEIKDIPYTARMNGCIFRQTYSDTR